TGANADKRVPLTPSEQKVALAYFYNRLNGVSGGGNLPEPAKAALDALAIKTLKNKSNTVVVTGIQDVNAQAVVLSINEMLGSRAFDVTAPKYVRQGSASAVNTLLADMKSGKVGALIIDGANPVYSLPDAAGFVEALGNVDLSVAFSTNTNETTEVVQYVGAANHYLESWGDAQFKKGHYSLMQPTIKELFDSRQFQTALLKWMGSDLSYYDYIKETWNNGILSGIEWNKALHDGVFVSQGGDLSSPVGSDTATGSVENGSVPSQVSLASAISNLSKAEADGMEITLYAKTGMGDGQQANNPWLQEFPDPITRVSWDNYLTISKADAEKMKFVNDHAANGGLDGSYAKLTVNGVSLDGVPVVIQPGQAPGSVGLSFGYGKTVGLKSEMQTGVNAYALYHNFSDVQSVTIEKSSGMHEFACVQLHTTLMGRGDIIKETTLEIFNTKDVRDWNIIPVVSLDHQEVPASSVDLWDTFDRSIGHHFNLSIDLNACTGCGACVIACHAENNV